MTFTQHVGSAPPPWLVQHHPDGPGSVLCRDRIRWCDERNRVRVHPVVGQVTEFVGDLLQMVRREAAQRAVQRGGFEVAGHHQVVEVAGNERVVPEVVPGLADVVEAIGDPELAWAFLSQEWPFGDTVMEPLKLLKAGRVDDVLGAAAGFGATFV